MVDGTRAPGADRFGAKRPISLFRGVLFVFSASLVLSIVFAVTGGTWADNASGADRKEDYPELFSHIDSHLERMYLDLDRVRPRPLLERALSFLEMGADEIYVETFDPKKPYVALHVDDKVKVLNLSSVRTRTDMVGLLETVFQFLERHYHGNTSLKELRYAAANGYLTGIDPHTLVFTPESFDEFESHIKGNIFGVGMMVGTDELGRLQVNTVLKETPAQRAGFQKNDIIVKIDDESTINMTVMEAVRKIRGPRGSKVVLTVRRKVKDKDENEKDEFETIAIPVERDRVEIKSVESKLLDPTTEAVASEKLGKGIGYVAVEQFDENTTRSLHEHLARLERLNGGPLAGLVIDLRGNSGGLLTQAIAMSDTFLKQGDIVVTVRGEDSLERERARDDGVEPKYPILLLADQSSASGAEIVLGALQKNNRGLVLGTPSFGKGSVQQLHELRHGARIKITVSEYLIPGDISIQENGVVPDIFAQEVYLEDDYSDIFATEESIGERNYDTHIVSKYKKDEEPSFRLRYLRPSADEDEPSSRELFISGDIRPESDPLVRMAWKVFGFIEDPLDPQAIFSTRRTELEALRDEFETEITQRLGELGIDWSEKPSGAMQARAEDLSVEVSHEIVSKPSEDPEDAVPVDWLVVRARASNRGDEPAWRVKGISRSEHKPFAHHEFLFGKLEPGATVERVRELRLPYFPNRQQVSFAVDLSSPGEEVLASGTAEILIERKPEPSFAYTATLETAEGEKATRLEAGKEYVLRVDVQNVGDGPVHKGIAILRSILETNRRHIFLKKGRIELSKLVPAKSDAKDEPSAGSKSTSVDFHFDVRKVDEAPPELFEFDLVIYDSYSNETLTHRVKIPSAAAHPDEAFSIAGLVQAPRIEARISAIRSAPNSDAEPGDGAADGESAQNAGESLLVTTEKEVRLDVSVRADTDAFKSWVLNSPLSAPNKNTDKIYFASSNGERELVFDTRVTLSPGVNVVSVVAQDARGIEHRESFVIRYDAPEGADSALTRSTEIPRPAGG
ncbi:MAG TPA: S41 family peptidase [Planctomycetota bacterium]|nr:S41 family peptidase [Planctomycetota bacterium]